MQQSGFFLVLRWEEFLTAVQTAVTGGDVLWTAPLIPPSETLRSNASFLYKELPRLLRCRLLQAGQWLLHTTIRLFGLGIFTFFLQRAERAGVRFVLRATTFSTLLAHPHRCTKR